MKVRVKYAKTGPLKFISHLDVMRYFQKNIRRAGLDIAYSTGLSPHEIISCVSWGAHWNGVNGLGTNEDAETVTLKPLARFSLGTEK